MMFFGGLGADTLVGNGGSDTYYYTDFLEGVDTIQTFSAADTIKIGYSFTNTYSRLSYHSDSSSGGSVYNINASGGNLPVVFNFMADNPGHNSNSATATALSNFRVTKDGSTDINTVEDFVILTGNGVDTTVWGWNNSGSNGTVESSELARIATLSSYDNDTFAASNVAFGSL